MNSNLNQSLSAVGILLSGITNPQKIQASEFDIEDILINAALKMKTDGRLASLMFSWIHIHSEHIIVDKIRKRIGSMDNKYIQTAISALAAYALTRKQHKWKKLITPVNNKYLFSGAAAESAVNLKGAEPWLAEYGILCAKESIRIRPKDVLSIEELSKINTQYRNRLLFGASWRSDIVTTIQEGAKSATEIMKRVGCSYEPAYRIRKEYLIAMKS